MGSGLKLLAQRTAWHFLSFAILHSVFFTAIMISSGNDISGDTCIRNSDLGYSKSHPDYYGCSIRWNVVIILNVFMTTALTAIFVPTEMFARGILKYGSERYSADNPNWKYLSIIIGFAVLFYAVVYNAVRAFYGLN